MSRARIALGACAAALFASAVLVPRQDVTIDVERVAGPVHVLTGRGGNVGLSIGADGVLMIDDQFANLAEKIEAAVAAAAQAGSEDGAEEGIDARPRLLLNTHWHGDHTGGNAYFGESATIFAHQNVRARLVQDGREVAALPVVTYADGISIHFNGEEIRVFHLPDAHTDGDSAVWFSGSKVLHTGDLCFSNAFPYVDLDSGGTFAGYLAALDELIERLPPGAAVIPGHGPLTDAAGLRACRTMLATVVERVRAALAEGKSAADMKADGLLDDLAERWEPQGAFIDRGRMIDIAARGLQDE